MNLLPAHAQINDHSADRTSQTSRGRIIERVQQPPAVPPGYPGYPPPPGYPQYGGYVPYVPPGPAAGLMYASFWRRLGGYVVDGILVGIPTAAILVPLVLGPYFSAV